MKYFIINSLLLFPIYMIIRLDNIDWRLFVLIILLALYNFSGYIQGYERGQNQPKCLDENY